VIICSGVRLDLRLLENDATHKPVIQIQEQYMSCSAQEHKCRLNSDTNLHNASDLLYVPTIILAAVQIPGPRDEIFP
jgi:hypothetical protein